MIRDLKYCFVLLISFIFLFGISNIYSNEISKYSIVLKGEFTQGSILFAEINGVSQEATGTVTFNNNEYDFENDKNTLFTSIPVGLATKSGDYKVEVNIEENGNKYSFSRTITIKSKSYGTQQLWMSEDQLAKYDNPQADRDNDAIIEALKAGVDDIEWDGQFTKPVQGRTSTGYGLRRYYNDDPEPEFHKGIDIASWNGCNIVAPQNAIVVMARENLVLHGTVLVLDHGRGVGSLYLHMGSICVKEGQRVNKGQVIGTIGSSGASTGPHLHWATYSHGVPINPWQLFAVPSSWIK